MTYKYYPNRPSRLTKEFVQEEFAKLIDSLPAAEAAGSPDLWLELFSEWNALKSYVYGEGSRISYAHSKDMENAEWEQEDEYYREEVTPVSDDGNSTLLVALLESKHKDAIGKRYGSHLLRSLATAVEPLAPVNNELRVKVGDLGNQYDKILSRGEVEVDGKRVTLAVARALSSSSDHRIRKEAYIAYREWILEHHDELARIFAEMVRLRDQMGRNLGHKNFIELGYLSMARTDYGQEEAKQFRASIRKYAVPLQSKLFESHAYTHGTDTLKPWDVGFHPSLTLPSGIAPIDKQLATAQDVFNAISPRLGKHFTRMVNEGLIDLENRKGKRAGAYCTTFSDEGRVAIFCNSTGDEDDVGTLMHEMGHAFQGWESMKIESVDLQSPTYDACEVHSMGMEYLSMPHMSRFFGDENAQKFQRNRVRDAVELLCYIAIVDEFQHWVYENPTCSIEDRDAAWSRIWDVYKPGLDFAGVEQYKYARWYGQGHIFQSPFYYIDYAIAETGAMQLSLMDEVDHEKALRTYITLCEIGGTKSVLEIFDSVGLRSPFDPTLMRDLMAHAAKVLDVDEVAVQA